MTIDEALKTYTSNAEYERTHGSLQGCLDFRQLAEWLKDYKRLLEQEPILDKIRAEIADLDVFYSPSSDDLMVKVDDILKIIDKYKAESEDADEVSD